MQPDTETNKKDLAPTEQWDQLAFTLMFQQLAPKGFKKFQNGHWKGAEHADIPFLAKKTVIQCQKIAAQLVRGFREKYRKDVEAHIKGIRDDIKLQESRRLYFWQIAKKSDRKWRIPYQKNIIIGLEIALKDLDNVAIK